MTAKTPDDIRDSKARGEKISALTAYDYPMGRLLDESGVDFILVGDSLGMVVLGLPGHDGGDDGGHASPHPRRRPRGSAARCSSPTCPRCSYRTPGGSPRQRPPPDGRGRAGCQAGGRHGHAPADRGADDGGAFPSWRTWGCCRNPSARKAATGSRAVRRTRRACCSKTARAVAGGGGVSRWCWKSSRPATARRVTAELAIPTIGIGSGPDCDGQILVTYDLIGLFPWFKPKFVSPKAQTASSIREAVAGYVAETQGQGPPDGKRVGTRARVRPTLVFSVA